MEHINLQIHAQPDALVKVFCTETDEVVYCDNTDDDGLTARLNLPAGSYDIDVTIYDSKNEQ